MPLHDRRPQLLSLDIKTSSVSSGQNDEVHTPLPTTPFAWTQVQAPLIMTPDTPYFDMSTMDDMFSKSPFVEKSKPRTVAEPEWTEDEDDLLSSYLSRPTASYPPGTLPPADVLDSMTTQIMNRLSRSSSDSSLSSAASSDTEGDMEIEETAPLPQKRSSGWPHSWGSTRARLFRIARLESREALGGHTRNNSESMVPVPKEKLAGPMLVVTGHTGLSRQQHSMDNILGGEQQTIEEAVKLSSVLQDQAMTGSSVLHSTEALSSPVAFEFGPSVYFTAPSTTSITAGPSLPLPRNNVNRKVPPSFPMSKSLPRPSLLQRGRSYTGADLARERGHSRNTSTSSDEVMDGDDETEVGSPMSSGNSLLALPPYGRPAIRRSATSPTAFIFPSASAVSSASSSRRGSVEADPITPLNQTSFPPSAFGLGNRVLTGDSDDSDSTPGSTPCITLTTTSPVSTPSDSSTPRLGASFDLPAVDFASLSINAPVPLIPSNTSALGATSGHIRRPTRPPPLTRSLSESTSLAGLAFSNPAQLSSSVSHPSGLNTHLGPTPTVTPVSRPCLTMSVLDGPESTRETKRQRAMPNAGSSAAVCRPRLNPGLKVVVPNTGLGGLASDGLRSPFEHKAPGGSVKI